MGDVRQLDGLSITSNYVEIKSKEFTWKTLGYLLNVLS